MSNSLKHEWKLITDEGETLGGKYTHACKVCGTYKPTEEQELAGRVRFKTCPGGRPGFAAFAENPMPDDMD